MLNQNFPVSPLRRSVTAPRVLLLCAQIGAIALPAFSHAQEQVQGDDAVLQMGKVEVNARSSGPLSSRNILSSVDILAPEVIQQQQVNHTWELLTRAPGVMLTQFRQGNESGKLSFRGFNGEGEVNAVKLLIDGIPSNDNGGGMPFLDMLFPLEISRIEIVRGTNDPSYGLHNIAGNVNMHTRTGGNDGEARLSYGSFRTREMQLAQGMEQGNWTQNYFAGYLQSAGYRQNSAFDKYTLSANLFYTTNDARTRIGVIARHTQCHGDEAGYLEAADAPRTPTASYPYAQSDGGNREMSQLSAHLDSDLTPSLSLSAKAYVNSVRDQRWLRYSLLASQQERIIDERHVGVLASLTYRPQALSAAWARGMSVEVGANAEHQQDRSPRYSTVDKVRKATTRDQRFDFDTYGTYVQAVFLPVPGLKIIPGYRVDKVQGDFSDPSKQVHYPIQDYGLIRQPKFSAVYSPWQAASIYANWGKTFQVGAGAGAYQSNANRLRPSMNEGWEAGVKFKPIAWADGRIALWRQDASDEVKRKLNDPTGDSENVGKTRREGIDLQLNVHQGERHSAWFAYSRQRTRIVEPDPAAPATLGKEIDHVPGHLYSAGYDFELSPAVKLSAWGNGQGDYFLTTANTGAKYGAYALLNLGLTYRVSRSLSLDMQLKNLADRYYEYVWVNNVTRHAPGDGRALYVSATMRF